jgi:uncharacterized protein YndB with AHSA1/START domain
MVDVTVSRTITASPEAVWALVSDPTRMGEWSPENLGAKWLGEVTGAAEGAQFRGSNKNGRFKWKTKCTVTECAESEAFAFDVKSGVIPIASWAYRLQAVEGGTEVTEEWTSNEAKWMETIANKVLQVDSRAEFNRSSMETTLAAMAAEVEATS